MLYTKACPRCSGDVKLDRDNYGVYAKCLQCGFNRDFQTRRDDFSSSIGTGMGTGSLFGPEVIVPELQEEEEQLDAA